MIRICVYVHLALCTRESSPVNGRAVRVHMRKHKYYYRRTPTHTYGSRGAGVANKICILILFDEKNNGRSSRFRHITIGADLIKTPSVRFLNELKYYYYYDRPLMAVDGNIETLKLLASRVTGFIFIISIFFFFLFVSFENLHLKYMLLKSILSR